MKRTESTSSAQAPKKTQPEEFDLVILGGGTGSTTAAWTFAGEGSKWQSSSANTSAGHARTSPARSFRNVVAPPANRSKGRAARQRV